MKNAFVKNNANEINNVTRKDNKFMKNDTITLTENDLGLCSAILKALNNYHAQRTPDEDFSSAYSTSDERRHEEVMERYAYITEQKNLLREALEEQDEEFDFFAYLDDHNITDPRLVKILEREFESYWDEVAYANESAEA